MDYKELSKVADSVKKVKDSESDVEEVHIRNLKSGRLILQGYLGTTSAVLRKLSEKRGEEYESVYDVEINKKSGEDKPIGLYYEDPDTGEDEFEGFDSLDDAKQKVQWLISIFNPKPKTSSKSHSVTAADRKFLKGKGFNIIGEDEFGNLMVDNFYDVVPEEFNEGTEDGEYGTETEEFQEWWNSNIGDDWGCQPDDDIEGNVWLLEKH